MLSFSKIFHVQLVRKKFTSQIMYYFSLSLSLFLNCYEIVLKDMIYIFISDMSIHALRILRKSENCMNNREQRFEIIISLKIYVMCINNNRVKHWNVYNFVEVFGFNILTYFQVKLAVNFLLPTTAIPIFSNWKSVFFFIPG